jgi:hypothetical protein
VWPGIRILFWRLGAAELRYDAITGKVYQAGTWDRQAADAASAAVPQNVAQPEPLVSPSGARTPLVEAAADAASQEAERYGVPQEEPASPSAA